jgi:hypothetical protein
MVLNTDDGAALLPYMVMMVQLLTVVNQRGLL